MKKIYAVTTIELSKTYQGHKDRRLVAWYSNLEKAIECVKNNWGDIYEGSYEWAVIEETDEGLYPHIFTEHWFRWKGTHKTGCYKKARKPYRTKGICNWGIG